MNSNNAIAIISIFTFLLSVVVFLYGDNIIERYNLFNAGKQETSKDSTNVFPKTNLNSSAIGSQILIPKYSKKELLKKYTDSLNKVGLNYIIRRIDFISSKDCNTDTIISKSFFNKRIINDFKDTISYYALLNDTIVLDLISYRNNVELEITDLTCLNIEEANFLLQSIGFNPIKYENSEAKNYIISQDPKYETGKKVSSCTKFLIKTSKKKPEYCF